MKTSASKSSSNEAPTSGLIGINADPLLDEKKLTAFSTRHPLVQPKLKIGQPNDKYEQEADRMARLMLRRPVPRIQRETDCSSCGDIEEEEQIQTKAMDDQTTPMVQRQVEEEEEEEEEETPVQAKLTIGEPDDAYEREADLMAEHVVQRFAQGESAPRLQRTCEECKIAPPTSEELEEEAEEDETETTTVNRKVGDTTTADGVRTNASFSNLEGSLERSKGGGRPLSHDIRLAMEDGFGQDFSDVRIHTGNETASMSRSIQAKAFTHESNIFFNEGKYNPHTKDGLLLLAHELTHVVQQTGSRPIQPKIQRSAEAKIGNWAHREIQKRLRSMDKELITEAPIPGGTRDDKKPNIVGFADLYKQDDQIVSGISAQQPFKSQDEPWEEPFYNYVNMRRDWKDKATSRSTIKFGPKIKSHKKDIWDFNPNFPSKFHVGEIKPLFPHEFPASYAYHGTGVIQAGNYKQGFEGFAARVYRDKPQHQGDLPASITGHFLDLEKPNIIPDAINYKKFELQHGTAGKDAILKKDTKPYQRVWFYNKYKNKDGVSVYFLIPHPYTSQEFPARIEKQLQRIDPLLRRLRQKRPRMANTLLTKPESPTQETSAMPAIHRKPVPGIQAKGKDWTTLARTWETDREKWVKGKGTGIDKPKEFLKEQAKGVEKKAKVDDKLGISPTSEKIKEEIKNVKKIRFWSSYRGRLLGALRFRFGHVFDKVEALFQKMKEKFKKHHTASGDLNKRGGLFGGWKKTATRAIIRFSVEIFKEMLVEAFRGFVNCINGIIEAIQGKFITAVDEAKEDLAEEIKPVCCEIMSFKNQLESEYEEHEQTIATFTETVEDLQQWSEILSAVEAAVRIGVQVVSCGSPPALGCLWGLVAQLGISAGLNLLARTDYFDEEIAKPAARQLMDAIVGDSLHNFLVEILEETPINSFLEEAPACRKRTRAIGGTRTIGGNLSKLDPNDPKNIKVRQEWEKEFEDQILQDLQSVFEKGKRKTVTKVDLEELVEFIRKSNLSPEEVKQLLEHARNPATGKLKLETAKANLERGELPETPPKERNIDYEKATRSNAAYQKITGWDPLQFVKKPGIKVDSQEFADAVYDMQEALDIEADGMLGEETVITFYEKNRISKDAVYREAVRIKKEKKEKKEREAAEKVKEEEGTTTAETTESKKTVIAFRVSKPPQGTPVIGRDPDYLQSSPGWISVPYGVVKPELSSSKTSYIKGEKLTLDVVYWIEKKWVWFTNIPIEYEEMNVLNEKRGITFFQPEDLYFKVSRDSETVYVLTKGMQGVYFFP